MIKGTGIDIIEIYRINKAMNKQSKFLERVFTPEEIVLFKQSNLNVATVAGFFAAKEAVMKALGTGLRKMKWKDIEIKKDNLGRPHVVLHNNAAKIAYDKGISEILISISHNRENAVAQAIAV